VAKIKKGKKATVVEEKKKEEVEKSTKNVSADVDPTNILADRRKRVVKPK